MFLDDSEELQIQLEGAKLGELLTESKAGVLHCYGEAPYTKVTITTGWHAATARLAYNWG
jgi:hypothetical protein